jgi:hypothetical protein
VDLPGSATVPDVRIERIAVAVALALAAAGLAVGIVAYRDASHAGKRAQKAAAHVRTLQAQVKKLEQQLSTKP